MLFEDESLDCYVCFTIKDCFFYCYRYILLNSNCDITIRYDQNETGNNEAEIVFSRESYFFLIKYHALPAIPDIEI